MSSGQIIVLKRVFLLDSVKFLHRHCIVVKEYFRKKTITRFEAGADRVGAMGRVRKSFVG